MGKFNTNIGALAQFTRDYLDMAPTFENLNRDLSSPEVQQSLNNLPAIISELQNFKRHAQAGNARAHDRYARRRA